MDTDSLYIAWSGKNINGLVKSELRKKCGNGGKAKFLSTSKYHNRTPSLFKQEFQGMRMIALTSKCYCADNYAENVKFSCKGVSKM